MRAAWMTAVAVLGLVAGGPVAAEPASPSSAAASARAQADPPRRAPPRIIITPRQPGATPYPLPGAAYPGPGYVRDCVSWLQEEPRPSGTVIVPRMRCAWVRGRA
ncbi:MAG TPA: hypothetical protein VFK79_13195 [Xanthobacteraceae bacterium]|nr:hypothetical protein [Xanthobacteraceae bacterium]